ncbi:hypothetical protein OZX65_03780 [Leuconostocaceae bacterium ESL0723]|nr:hypothetical protein OZX65_03780 [Leuconostocaceae bacterium ESL0723]
MQQDVNQIKISKSDERNIKKFIRRNPIQLPTALVLYKQLFTGVPKTKIRVIYLWAIIILSITFFTLCVFYKKFFHSNWIVIGIFVTYALMVVTMSMNLFFIFIYYFSKKFEDHLKLRRLLFYFKLSMFQRNDFVETIASLNAYKKYLENQTEWDKWSPKLVQGLTVSAIILIVSKINVAVATIQTYLKSLISFSKRAVQFMISPIMETNNYYLNILATVWLVILVVLLLVTIPIFIWSYNNHFHKIILIERNINDLKHVKETYFMKTNYIFNTPMKLDKIGELDKKYGVLSGENSYIRCKTEQKKMDKQGHFNLQTFFKPYHFKKL